MRLQRRGFSLLELLVVITVALVLTGLLLPAMTQVRESAHRVLCGSNLRQIGLATFMYDKDYGGLPFSSWLEGEKKPQELMAAHRGISSKNWDGLGLVYYYGYCKAADCFYCPSHRGNHSLDRYEHLWREYETVYGHVAHDDGTTSPAGSGEGDVDDDDEDEDEDDEGDEGESFDRAIYTNYHYAGHRDWRDNTKRSLERGDTFVLAVDGLRTIQDFNHQVGWNALNSDGSVTWQEDNGDIYSLLPTGALQGAAAVQYEGLWGRLERH